WWAPRTRAAPTSDSSGRSKYGGPRYGPPNPPTFGAPRLSRGAPLYVPAARGTLLLDQHAAQDLARRRFRDRIDDGHPTNLLVGRHATSDPVHPLGWRDRCAEHDEGLRDLAGLLVGARNHRGVHDRGMREQQAFELGRRHLHALVFDQLLDAIDDVEVAVGVGVAHVARVQPALGVDRARGRLRVVPVAAHDVRPAHANLAALTRR